MSVAGWGYPWGAPAASSGYVTILIPMFKWYTGYLAVSSTNNTITFGEGAADLTATVASGRWAIGGELCGKIKRALEAAGAGTYTVTYSQTTRLITIAKNTGTFTLNLGGNAADLLDDLGYTGDKSGALTYTADTSLPAAKTTATCTQYARGPQLDPDRRRTDTILDSGASQSVSHGRIERYAFRLEFETVAVAQALRAMDADAGQLGTTLEYYPDSTDSSKWIECILERCDVREMTPRSLYRLYEIDIGLRFKFPSGDSTITNAGDFLDRRPGTH